MQSGSCWLNRGLVVLVIMLGGGILGTLLPHGAQAAGLMQGLPTATPAAAPIAPPIETARPVPADDLQELLDAVEQENLEWENLTRAGELLLGDPSLQSSLADFPTSEPFPEFVVESLTGAQIALSDFGGPVLANFWASWCGPCRLELPLLLEMHEDVDAPFAVVLLNSWESVQDYQTYASEHLPPSLAAGRAPDELLAALNLEAVPTSVLLDQDRRVLAVHVGNITEAVVALFYHLAAEAAAEPPVPQPAQTEEALQVLRDNLARENLATGASTLWEGGSLGLEDPLHLAFGIGDKFPAFGLETRSGEAYQSDLVESPQLINFWASWCVPCVVEFPLLVEARDAGYPFEIVFVNVWDDVFGYESFVDGYPSDIAVMFDGQGLIPAQYGLEFVPVTVLVDAEGTVRMIQRGPVNEYALLFAASLLP
ncbi:MAG: hypothetical protein Kow0077_18780 [Anaerolineae bacterium]